MNLLTLQVGSYEVNCTILENGGEALVVDPGQEPERIAAALDRRHWRPVAILLTHGHFDHVNGIPGLLAKYPSLPVCVSAADAEVMSHPLNRCPPEYGPVTVPAANLRTGLNSRLSVLRTPITVIPTPGHTPGGVCYYLPEFGDESGGRRPLLLSGDTLFAGSVGRTDLPGGDMATLMRSLDSLRALPEDTQVIPGHGMTTTIGRELASNPFLQ